MKIRFPCCVELALQYVLPFWTAQYCPNQTYTIELKAENHQWATYVMFENESTYVIFALTFEEFVLTSTQRNLQYLINEGFNILY